MWREQQQFTFPTVLGDVEDVLMANVAVNWQQVEGKLQGLYIVKMKVRFNLQPVEQGAGTFVEHLDIEDDIAYFEYGIPFERDITEQVEQLRIEQIETDLKPLVIAWQVQERFAEKAVEELSETTREEPLFSFTDRYVRQRYSK